MKNDRQHLFYIHLAVVLFGLSGLFAKFISYHALIIVLGRVFFAACFLFLMIKISKQPLPWRNNRDKILFLLIGAVLAVHWGSFFYSIQISTVAIGLITFATFPVFSAFLEPLFFKEDLRLKNIVFAIVTFLGVLFIVPEFSLDNNNFQGVLWGLLSAITFAVLSISNRKLVGNYSSIAIGFYQNSIAFIILLPVLFLIPLQIQLNNLLLLIVLGIVFTGVSHVLFIQGLKTVNVQEASIIACLEPVYGIIAAVFLIGEMPNIKEFAGILIILVMAVFVTIQYGRTRKQTKVPVIKTDTQG